MTEIMYSAPFPDNATTQDEVIKWCTEKFGPCGKFPNNNKNDRWVALEWTIQFRDRKDRNWFLLRWS